MSSTNRSNARDNHVSDYYVTPHQPIIDLLEAMTKEDLTRCIFNNDNKLRNYIDIFDPCAGGNPSSNKMGFNPMSYPYVLQSKGALFVQTNDIREDSLAEIKSDYIASEPIMDRADIIITNPPFNKSVDIIKKAQLEVREGGYVIMLLRLNFFGSKERAEFWKDNMPSITFVHRKRISFLKGATDSIEYMHCVWIKGVNQNHTKLVII
jgi:hypothetical protein